MPNLPIPFTGKTVEDDVLDTMSRPTLFIDVDDTIIANCHQGSGFDLRPGVITQLRGLNRMFNCRWLTCWSRTDIFALVRALYGTSVNKNMTYADWEHGHPLRKAGYVLDPNQPKDWWWLEDPLCNEEMRALIEHNKLDRYIRVEPFGNWAFLDSVNELFRRAGITEAEMKRCGVKPEWFNKEAILTQNSDRENLRESLSLLQHIAASPAMTPEERLREVQTFIENQINTIF